MSERVYGHWLCTCFTGMLFEHSRRHNQIATFQELDHLKYLAKLRSINLSGMLRGGAHGTYHADTHWHSLVLFDNHWYSLLEQTITIENPVAELENYRLEVLKRLPNLEKIDKDEIATEERSAVAELLKSSVAQS